MIRVLTEKEWRKRMKCACGWRGKKRELAQLPDSGGWSAFACPSCKETTKLKQDREKV